MNSDPWPDNAWLELACRPGIGAVFARRLLDHFGTPAAALAASDEALAHLGLPRPARRSIQHTDQTAYEAARRWLDTPDRHFVTEQHPCFPRALTDIETAPLWLYASGDVDLLTRPAIAVVGSRNPTAGGRELAHEFARSLASAGLVIVSGLARGIDAAAHEGALAAGGMTIAVCGTGLDQVYPAINADLAQRIAANGLLVSEFGLGTLPLPGNFPRRNRVIAGLGQATLVVEAARESGSLITARLAGEFGREVFAVPGSIHNPLARGCHQLIRNGAELVESVDQVIESLLPRLRAAGLQQPDQGIEAAAEADQTGRTTDPADSSATLIQAMGHAPARIDELAARTGWHAADVASTLLILELEGRVVALPGGAYAPT